MDKDRELFEMNWTELREEIVNLRREIRRMEGKGSRKLRVENLGNYYRVNPTVAACVKAGMTEIDLVLELCAEVDRLQCAVGDMLSLLPPQPITITPETAKFILAPGVKVSGPDLLQTRILPNPVHIKERLPKATDCDLKGRCWLTTTETEPGWILDNPEQCTNYTHWLPHSSIPVP